MRWKPCKKIGFAESYANWVMRSHNADDLENMIALCGRHAVKGLIILAFKPDSARELNSYPAETQLRAAAKIVRKYEDCREAPCKGCALERHCLPCAAVGMKLRGDLKSGMAECPLAGTRNPRA